MKAPREREGLGFGKGGYWCMHPDYEDKLTSQAYVKRKKKGIPVFPFSWTDIKVGVLIGGSESPIVQEY